MKSPVTGDKDVTTTAAHPLVFNAEMGIQGTIRRRLFILRVQGLVTDAPSCHLPPLSVYLDGGDEHNAFKGDHVLGSTQTAADSRVVRSVRRFSFGFCV